MRATAVSAPRGVNPGSKSRKRATDQKKKTKEPASSPTVPNPTESASPTQEGFQDPNCAEEIWEPMPSALGWESEWEYGYEKPPSSEYHSNGNVSNKSSPLTGSPRPKTPRANPAPAKPERTSEAKAQPASDKGLEGKEGRPRGLSKSRKKSAIRHGKLKDSALPELQRIRLTGFFMQILSRTTSWLLNAPLRN